MRRPATPGAKEPPQPPGGRARQRAQQFARSRGLPDAGTGGGAEAGSASGRAPAGKPAAKKAPAKKKAAGR
jgi:hypothetical protein